MIYIYIIYISEQRCKKAEDQELSFLCQVCSSRPEHRVVRLAGATAFSGRLELLHDGRWGTVCGRNFTDQEAQVVCHQLGLRGGSVLGALSGSGPIWLHAAFCDGSEWDLGQCATLWAGDCTHAEAQRLPILMI